MPVDAAKKALAQAFQRRDVRGTLNATLRFLSHEFYVRLPVTLMSSLCTAQRHAGSQEHEDRVTTHHNLWVPSPLRAQAPS